MNIRPSEILVLRGRSRFAEQAVWELELRHNDDTIVLVGADLTIRNSGTSFDIDVLHPTATDVEHDSAYLAKFEGAGLVFKHMMGADLVFEAALWAARYWLPGEFEEQTEGTVCSLPSCDSGAHPIGPYLPPHRQIKAGIYSITLRPASTGPTVAA